MKEIKNYIVFLKESHTYNRLNLPKEEAMSKHPEQNVILKKGTVLYSQDEPFTIEQIIEAKEKGFPHQWGFGPCCEQIPFEKLQYAKVEMLNV